MSWGGCDLWSIVLLFSWLPAESDLAQVKKYKLGNLIMIYNNYRSWKSLNPINQCTALHICLKIWMLVHCELWTFVGPTVELAPDGSYHWELIIRGRIFNRQTGERETVSDRKLLSCQHITTDTGNVHCSVHNMLTSHEALGNKKIVFPHTICSKLECSAFHLKYIMLAFGLENCLFWFVVLALLLQSNILQTVFYCSFWWCYKAQGLKTFGLILEPDHQQYKCGLL